jgi:hypothetical protein
LAGAVERDIVDVEVAGDAADLRNIDPVEAVLALPGLEAFSPHSSSDFSVLDRFYLITL